MHLLLILSKVRIWLDRLKEVKDPRAASAKKAAETRKKNKEKKAAINQEQTPTDQEQTTSLNIIETKVIITLLNVKGY